ncbi:MAG: ABC transporter permease [Bacteroidales bacterium]|nr:ABC transporter permease [Bacteroidales bacterium]
MNIKQNFRQSLQIIKQNPLYSTLYILGTALAISMIMVISIGYNIKVGNVYPEVNRDRTLEISQIWENSTWSASMPLSAELIDMLTKGVDGIEAVCIDAGARDIEVERGFNSESKMLSIHFYNEIIWTLNSYRFVDGVPFTHEDVQSKVRKAVLSKSTAQWLYRGERAVGKSVVIEGNAYTVCGVIDDVSTFVYNSRSDIYAPNSLKNEITGSTAWGGMSNLLGDSKALILAHSRKDFNRIKTQIEENVAKVNSTMDGITFSLHTDEPASVVSRGLQNTFSAKEDEQGIEVYKSSLPLIILIFVIIVLASALNLSGIIATGAKDRESESGIRRAFGAQQGNLLQRLIRENLTLSILGGIAGVLISYLFVWLGSGWLAKFVNVPWNTAKNIGDFDLTFGMLVNYKVLITAFVSCLVINCLSALIPHFGLRSRQIVSLLHGNESLEHGSLLKKNRLIIVELLLAFVVTWLLIDPLYVLNLQKSLDNGFDTKNLYSITLKQRSSKSPDYVKESREERDRNDQIFLSRIKDLPFVEDAVDYQGIIAMDMAESSANIKASPGDTAAIRVYNAFFSNDDNDYFDFLGMEIYPKDINYASLRGISDIVISKSLAKQFFGREDAIGEKVYWQRSNGCEEQTVRGICEDAKMSLYKQPVPVLLSFSDKNRVPIKFGIDFFARSKAGISEHDFINKVNNTFGNNFSVGNRVFNGIVSYQNDYIYGHAMNVEKEKELYTILALFVLLNLFTGIFSMFFLQSRRRKGEIGIRRAMGARKSNIRGHFIAESLVLASVSALAGIAVLINVIYFKGFFIFGEKLPGHFWAINNPFAHFTIVTLITFGILLITVILGTIIPATAAADTKPIDALRDE